MVNFFCFVTVCSLPQYDSFLTEKYLSKAAGEFRDRSNE